LLSGLLYLEFLQCGKLDFLEMFYNILDKERQEILPLLAKLPAGFYLAGGTALALQIGHRDSVDFDFFIDQDIDTNVLFEELREVFQDHELLKTQEEKNTLSVIIDGSIKLSFMTFKYSLLSPLIKEQYINIASKEDIACMKLSAITSRATQKDYIDIFFLLKEFSLSELLTLTKQKFPSLDENVVLKSLVFFEDVIKEPIKFTVGSEVDFREVENKLKEAVKGIGF